MDWDFLYSFCKYNYKMSDFEFWHDSTFAKIIKLIEFLHPGEKGEREAYADEVFI